MDADDRFHEHSARERAAQGQPDDHGDLSDLAATVATKVRDAAYVAIGLGVLGAQRAQVRRRELAHQASELDRRVATARRAVAVGAEQFDQWLGATVKLVDASLKPLEEQLPTSARKAADQARRGMRELQAQVHRRITPR